MLRRFLRWLMGVPARPEDVEESSRLAATRDRQKTDAIVEADRSNLAGGMRGGPGGEQYRG